VVQSVTQEFSIMGSRNCRSAEKMTDGAGRMVIGTEKVLHTTSQITNKATVKTVGETTLIIKS
jgi:hypothetical protein